MEPDASPRPALELSGLSASYGNKPVLRDVSLAVRTAEVLAVFGPNGAGKSTLLKAIGGLVPALGGSVVLDGRDCTQWPTERRVQAGIALVLQGGQVFPSLTVLENLRLASRATGRKGDRSATRDFEDVVPQLKGLLGRRAGVLSGGERQMLAIAMALSLRSRVLLLDEPTAGLSPRVAEDVLRSVREHACAQGVAVVLVEQRVHEGLGTADQALVIRNGRVSARTTRPADWLEGETFDTLFLAPEQ